MMKPVACTAAEKATHGSTVSAQIARVPASYRLKWGQAEPATAKRCRVVGSDAGFNLWETPLGRFWVPKRSNFLAFDLAEQELQLYGVGPQGVQPGDTVLDCGANIGLFSRVALRSGARRVIAIEPAAENLECLRRNLKDEIASGSVVIVEQGVWDHRTTLTFTIDPTNSAADHFAASGSASLANTIQVPVTTIDLLVAELGLSRVDFIKMDIEGSERQALAGARTTLAGFKPRLAITTYHKPDDLNVLPAIIRQWAPAYVMECGSCTFNWEKLRVEPEVLFFR
jgi:FkbM family methyltransferase